MPFVVITFAGCMTDDIRKLGDPALAYFGVPGNPVSDWAAAGLACARIPKDSLKKMVRWNVDASGLSCDPAERSVGVGGAGSESKNWAEKYALYCVTQSGEPVNLQEAPDLLQQLNSACETTPA